MQNLRLCSAQDVVLAEALSLMTVLVIFKHFSNLACEGH